MIYPKDALTKTIIIQGVTDETLITKIPNTILAIRIQQSGIASETMVLCGVEPVALNYAKDFPISLVNYVCNDIVKVEKTGQDEAFISVTYVPYDISKNDTSSTSPYFVWGFSYGEIILSIFVFMIFIMFAFKSFWNAIFHKKITLRRPL